MNGETRAISNGPRAAVEAADRVPPWCGSRHQIARFSIHGFPRLNLKQHPEILVLMQD